VVFGREGCNFSFAESDDFVCIRIDDFAETVAFYRFIIFVVDECQIELAI
jgi:hypothetical protein